ncbi:MAG: type II secretion system protein [Candidatus Eremiobacteraeota bacterium]|nr:type II secretion system protein [Candidatus Eremiobacteraeota bacterium]
MRRRGFSMLEVIVVLGMAALVALIFQLALRQSIGVYRKVGSEDVAMRNLRKARDRLSQELAVSCFQETRVGPGPTSLVGRDGDAIWFLSAIDPATGNFLRRQDGTPFWQRTILYYPVIPTNKFAGAGLSVGGYEASCPNKVLVRKVLDTGTPTNPADESTAEQLPSDISTFLDRPDNFDTSAMNGQMVTLVATDLVTFQAVADPAVREVRFDVRSLAIGDASRELAVGSVDLFETRFTSRLDFSIFPVNRSMP